MTSDDFGTLVRSRRSVRHFSNEPVAPDLLHNLLDTARWSPSGYNLQPTHFVCVTDPALRPALRKACMGQVQIEEAAAVIVFAGDRQVAARNFEEVLRLDRSMDAISPDYESLLRRVVPLAFGHGPLGLGWLWKAALIPLARLAVPIPSIPGVHKRYWVTKQVMLSAMTFMLAASASGLATLPMEGFDERRVRRVVGLPRRFIVPIVVAVGHAAPGRLIKSRLPLERMLHHDHWSERC